MHRNMIQYSSESVGENKDPDREKQKEERIMKMSFRWYGESDPISLEYISQIPGMRSIVSAVYDV